MTKPREAFIFYHSFYEAIKDLPDDDRLQVYDALAIYSTTQKIPEMSLLARMGFTIIKPSLDRSITNYANGKNGGRPRKTDDGKNRTETETKPNDNRTETETKPTNTNTNTNTNTKNKTNTKDSSLRSESPNIENLDDAERVITDQFRWLIDRVRSAVNSPSLTDFTLLKVWLRDGYSPQHILSAIEANAQKPKTALTSLRYFESMVRDKPPAPKPSPTVAAYPPCVKQELRAYVSYVDAEKNHENAYKEMAIRQKIRSTPEQLKTAYEEKYGHRKIVKS